jgi:hypothetical protein
VCNVLQLLEEIIPLHVAPGEMIQLHHATRTVDEDEKSKTVTYSHIVYPEEGGDGKKGNLAENVREGRTV